MKEILIKFFRKNDFSSTTKNHLKKIWSPWRNLSLKVTVNGYLIFLRFPFSNKVTMSRLFLSKIFARPLALACQRKKLFFHHFSCFTTRPNERICVVIGYFHFFPFTCCHSLSPSTDEEKWEGVRQLMCRYRDKSLFLLNFRACGWR